MKARPLFFGLSTAFMFLNLGFSNEIFPYWLLLIPFIRKIDKKFLYIIITFSILILINFFYFVNLNLYLLDSLQFISVLFAFLIYKDFNNIERNFFFKTLVYLVWLQCFVMILQSIFPSIQNSVSVLFSGRDHSTMLNALLRNNAVTGFSPEPSYGSALLVGIFFMISISNYSSRLLIIPVIISLLLFKSVYGLLLFYCFLTLNFLHNGRFLKLFAILNILILLILFYGLTSNFSSVLRLIEFINQLYETGSIYDAQKLVSPDSTRLDFLNFLGNFNFPFNYNKSVSFGVFILQSLNYIIFIFMLIIISKTKYLFWNFIIITISLIITPLLVWPLIFYLLKLLHFKKIKIQ